MFFIFLSPAFVFYGVMVVSLPCTASRMASYIHCDVLLFSCCAYVVN